MKLEPVTLVTASLMLLAFGVGLGLKLHDFASVATRPKGVIAGATSQMVLMPSAAVALAS